jgi:hypothetical protein
VTRPSLDRAAKAVWLAIGVLVLAGLVVGTVASVVSYATSGSGDAGPAASTSGAKPASGDAAPLRAARFDAPRAIPGTAWRMTEVRRAGGDAEEDAYSSRGRVQSVVNVIFLPPGGGTGRLLLDRPAFVDDVGLPGAGPDSAQAWIIYHVTFRDTNGDGLLTGSDSSTVYVSGLDGSNLRRVLPPPYVVRAATPLAPGRILVLALVPSADPDLPQERWPERAFVYDVATGRAEPYAALDSLSARAASLLPK